MSSIGKRKQKGLGYHSLWHAGWGGVAGKVNSARKTKKKIAVGASWGSEGTCTFRKREGKLNREVGGEGKQNLVKKSAGPARGKWEGKSRLGNIGKSQQLGESGSIGQNKEKKKKGRIVAGILTS